MFFMHILFACNMHECTCMVMQACTWGSQGVHAFSCLFVFQKREPYKSRRLSPNYLSHWWMVEVWDQGLAEEGSEKDGESEWWTEGEREVHARQFPWRWVIHRHMKCLTSHPEKCPQQPTCVKGVIEHNWELAERETETDLGAPHACLRLAVHRS